VVTIGGVKRIVCLGDSLTSGHGIGTAAAFPALLHQRVRRAGFPYEVINAGVSRSTSADGPGWIGPSTGMSTCSSWHLA